MKTLKKFLIKDNAVATPLWNAIGIHVFLIIGVTLCLLPFFQILMTSFKTYNESIQIPPVWIPSEFRFDAFIELFTKVPIAIMLYNSIVTTIMVVTGQILFSALAGFSLAMIESPYKKVILTVCLAILMVPGQVYLLPQFLLIQKMGLTNTLIAIALPGLVSAFGTFLYRQAFLGLPRSLYEAALLDGCNPFQIFWSVMFPLVKPTTAAFGVLAALYNWNSLLWPLVVNTLQSKYPLSVGIATIMGDFVLGTRYPTLMASSIIALIPMIIVFLIFRKAILDNNSYLGDK